MSEKPRVLAVDDEQRGVELVARTLRRIAIVDVATCGEEAWDLFKQTDYDIVISDQRMPGISGVELLAKVWEAKPLTGRVLLTGYADIEATIDAINKGRIHAYVNKPCSPDQLRMITTTTLNRVELERTNERLVQELNGRNDELEEVLASLRREQKAMVDDAYSQGAKDSLANLRSRIFPVAGQLQLLARSTVGDLKTRLTDIVAKIQAELESG